MYFIISLMGSDILLGQNLFVFQMKFWPFGLRSLLLTTQ
jgi:hypothetical protein